MGKLMELKEKTIKELEKLKNNLSYDNEKDYCELINIAIDYDNEAHDRLYLCDCIHEMLEIVDEETIQYFLEDEIKEAGCNRLFYIFRGIEYPDNIYKINVYGNLENVNSEDILMCIDELLERLK